MSNPESAETEKNVRERILEAAIAILSEDGINALSQVQVARRAEVRQSHLTYYFPKRVDLISAIAERVVSRLATGAREVMAAAGAQSTETVLALLADGIASQGHMRMFIGSIVEADGNPDVRAILMRETVRLEKALADLLGGENATERARLVVAALWGLGLYAFLAKERAGNDLSLLFGAAEAPEN